MGRPSCTSARLNPSDPLPIGLLEPLDRRIDGTRERTLQWVALASDLTEYPRVSVTVPAPSLKGTVKPGDSVEGWVAFAVDKKDSGPIMAFSPDSGGATGRGKTLFFKLYRD